MPKNTTRGPRSTQSHYGTRETRYADNDERLQKNFTQDNEDYYANAAQYNDLDESLFDREDRMAAEHRDRPEPKRRYDRQEDFHPSNYSDGGHGRKTTEPHSYPNPNCDNADYPMNKDFERGAADRYDYSEKRYTKGNPDNPESSRGESLGRSYPQDDRYRQSDWAPQDRFNEIAPDRHREASQNRHQPQLNSNPNTDHDYHHCNENHETLDREARRRGRHYKEY